MTFDVSSADFNRPDPRQQVTADQSLSGVDRQLADVGRQVREGFTQGLFAVSRLNDREQGAAWLCNEMSKTVANFEGKASRAEQNKEAIRQNVRFAHSEREDRIAQIDNDLAVAQDSAARRVNELADLLGLDATKRSVIEHGLSEQGVANVLTMISLRLSAGGDRLDHARELVTDAKMAAFIASGEGKIALGLPAHQPRPR